MQRPILATVHRNPQMADLLRGQGHVAVQTGAPGQGPDEASKTLAGELVRLFDLWRATGLPDSGRISPYTTQAAVGQLLNDVRVAA
jgi:hypothetical protein